MTETRRLTVLHGDAIDVMRTYPDAHFDGLVMDPPYTAAGGSTNGRSGGHSADTQFFAYWLRDIMAEIRRVVKPTACGFVFCDWRTVGLVAECMTPPGNRQTAPAWSVSQALVWDRESIGLGAPFRNAYEMIAFARGPEWRSTLPKDIPTVIRHRYPYGRHEHHGAEKPVGLCERLLQWCLPEGGRVLDPFAGSGTVGVACARLGEAWRYTGIENDEENHRVAEKRLTAAERAPAQLSAFAADVAGGCSRGAA